MHDLFKALCSLNCGKAMGGDGIPPIILKGTAAAILEPLHHLFAMCTQKSSLSAEWRDHYITPIPKSGDRSVVSNYRPISLLSCISKLFERLVFDQVSTFLMETSLSNSQFGFIQNRSAVKQLLLHTKSIISALDSHQQLDTVFLDIRKAFDSVPHDQLLLKLWNLGITGSVWQLIKSYLTGWRQCVRVEGQLSGWLPVCSGVPQGSILGPLLFLTYINDLPSFVSFSSTLLFADDTKLSRLVSSPSHCSELQADITALQQWSSSSELSFNASKSFLLRFCTMLSPISVDYDLNGSSIPSVSHGRDLGIMFSSDLSWSEHYKLVCSSAYRQLGLLKRTFSTACPSHIKKLMYISLVRSRLTYCSQVWRPMLIKDIVTLETVQRRATKFTVAASSVSYRDRLITLNLLPLMYFYEYLDLLFLVHSLKFPDGSFDIRDHLQFLTRCTSGIKLQARFCSTNRSRHFFFNRVTRLWNALPPIDLSLSISSIKASLKKILWAHFLEHFDSSNYCSYHFLCPCSSCHVATPAPVGFL